MSSSSTQCYLQLKDESIWTGTYKVHYEKECCHFAITSLTAVDYKHFKYWMKDDDLMLAIDFTNEYEPRECSRCGKPKLELAAEITNALNNGEPGSVLCWLDESFVAMMYRLVIKHMTAIDEEALRAKLVAVKL